MCHPGRGGRFCQYTATTAVLDASGSFVRCNDGRAGTLCQFSDAETCNGQGTVDGAGGCACNAAGRFVGAACNVHRCGDDLSCYTSSTTAVSPGEVPVADSNGNTPEAHTEASGTPHEGEPFISMASAPAAGSPATTTTVNATVQIRGEDGSLATLYPMNTTHHVDQIWLTDGTGALLGNHSFVAPRDEDGSGHAAADRLDAETFRDPELEATATFAVPADVAEVQAHSYSAEHGLRSGPVIDAQLAMSAAAIEQQARHPNGTSIDPEGPHSYRVTDGLNDATATGMAEHEPYTFFDPATATGTVTVLGPNGAIPALPDDDAAGHGVSALWAEDQHGTVVAMQEYDPADPAHPELDLDLADNVPAVTEIRPFSYSPTRGLVEGSDVIHDLYAPEPAPPTVATGIVDDTSSTPPGSNDGPAVPAPGAADSSAGNDEDGGIGAGAIAGMVVGGLLLAGAGGVALHRGSGGGSGGGSSGPGGDHPAAASGNPAMDGFGFAATPTAAIPGADGDGYLEVHAGGPP